MCTPIILVLKRLRLEDSACVDICIPEEGIRPQELPTEMVLSHHKGAGN